MNCGGGGKISPTPPEPPSPPTIEEQIRKIAEETTVLIGGSSDSGSGVIVASKGNTYYVLTAKHVVGIEPGESEYPYQVQSKTYAKPLRVASAKDYKEKVKKFKDNVDLAIIEFEAEAGQKFQVAQMADSLYKGMSVYASGWTSCLPLDKKQKRFHFTVGKICKIEGNAENGYNVRYTNNIVKGLSGGPIFDSMGRVVAIQAALVDDKGKEFDRQACESIPKNPNNDFSDARGVSIKQNLSELKSKLPSETELNLQKSISRQADSKDDTSCRTLPTYCPPILPPGQRCQTKPVSE